MPLFGACEHCADYRAQRDKAQATVDALLEKQADLVAELMAVKRHDLGIPPKGFEPLNPTDLLGPKTWAAIEEMSGGFADLRAQQINHAIGMTKSALAEDEGAEDVDTMVAHAIRQGDGG